MRWHELKTDPAVFDAVADGSKTHEIRFNDRDFKVGDGLLLRRTRDTGWAMKNTGAPLEFTGQEFRAVVTHILDGYGLMPGWVILSIKPHGVPEGGRGVPVDKDRCPSCGIRYGYHLASCTALADGEPERKRPASGAALPLPPAGPTGSGGWCEMCGVTHEGPHPAGVEGRKP